MSLQPKRLFSDSSTMGSRKKAKSTQVDKAVRKAITRYGMKPERKCYEVTFSTAQLNNGVLLLEFLCDNITQGTGPSQRIGDQIRLSSIEVRGDLFGNSSLISAFLVRPNGASVTPPQLGHFVGVSGTRYIFNYGWEIACWQAVNMNGAGLAVGPYDGIVKFKIPMLVKYFSAAPIRNGVYFCIPNTTGANVTGISGSVRVYFYDA